ncbi:MAG: 2-hydroxyacyl-CoA dehydratase [Nitrospirae bacterium]|nr:2-hydroxyacyl-CoA dehydratase [Nitrospirota bacterium]
MDAKTIEIKSYPEMWESLGVNVERFEKMRCVMGDMYSKTFLMQDKRPAGMDYFDYTISEIHGARVAELVEAKKSKRPVVGTFCVFVPEEIIVAAGGICIGLCGGSQGPVPDAERILPRNICPMVKSAYGFKVAKVCPYFQAVDFVYGETTCDAKKKTWELLDREVPTYVMEIPQMKRERDKALWLEEVKDFKTTIEDKSGHAISADDLANAISLINGKRRALQRLNRLRSHTPAPISGKDGLLIEQIAFYDDPTRFTQKLNDLCDELEERVKSGFGVAPSSSPRIMVSGTPMALPNWKIHNIVETLGGVIVNEESCIGTRYFKDLIDEEGADMDRMLADLTDRYMKIDCSCFTPNNERIDQVIREYKESNAQGILHYCLQFCHTYNIEAVRLREACEKEGVPFLAVESDYSPEDVGQLQTRIEAFLEQIREA